MGYLHVLAQRGVIHATWVSALEPVSSNLAAMGDCLRSLRSKGESFLPAPRNILRAFRYPFDSVRVLIVGQDPYPPKGIQLVLALLSIIRCVRFPAVCKIYTLSIEVI